MRTYILTLVYEAEDAFCEEGIIQAVRDNDANCIDLTQMTIQLHQSEEAVSQPVIRRTMLSDLDNQAEREFNLLAMSQGTSISSYSSYGSVEEVVNSLQGSLRESAEAILEAFYSRQG